MSAAYTLFRSFPPASHVRGVYWEPALLLLDDSELVQRALRRELESLGHRVFVAGTVQEAIEVIEDELIETAVVDLFLGPEDGLDFLRYLEMQHPGVKRVLISGETRPCQLRLAEFAGRVEAVLSKPWERASLVRAVGEKEDDHA